MDAVTRFHVLCREGRVSHAQAHLATAGVDVGATDTANWTALHYACCHGQAAAASWLLDAGAPVDARDVLGRSPLAYACLNGHVDVITVLARRGADLDLADRKRETPLMCGIASEHEHVVALLCRLGADTDRAGLYDTPILRACRVGSVGSVLAIVRLSQGLGGEGE